MQRFIAYLGLSEMVALPVEVFAQSIKALIGTAPITVSPPHGLVDAPYPGLRLAIGGTDVLVMIAAEPLPVQVWSGPASYAMFWADASATFGAAQAHVIVATLKAPGDHATAVAAATAVTLAAGAAAATLPVVGTLFETSGVMIKAKDIALLAKSIAQDRSLPVPMWVGITLYRANAGAVEVGARSRGLASFLGRELDFKPATVAAEALIDRALDTAQYLLLHGDVLVEGNTIGASEEPPLQVHRQDNDLGATYELTPIAVTGQALGGRT